MNHLLAFTFIVAFTVTHPLVAYSGIKTLTGEGLLSSQKITASTEGKKGLVVIFLSAKCPCSNSHIDELKDLAQKYTDFSFVAIHSNVDEAPNISKTYFEKIALPFPVIQDKNTELADRLQALKTPHAFILNTEGDIAYQGGVSNSKNKPQADRLFLREALEDIQAGKTIRTPEGRTLGCVISRGN